MSPSSTRKIEIRINDEFPHLRRAPIIEAVIDLRAHPSVPFEEKAVRKGLEPLISNYKYLDSQREVRHELQFSGESQPQHTVLDLGVKGIRFQTDDKKQIAQFNRDGFAFSWMEQYPDWTAFSGEGIRLWRLYKQITKSLDINRVGLRYINRIELPAEMTRLDELIQPAPESPRDLELPFAGFMHHDTLAVPGYPYAINLIRTIQPPQGEGHGAGLILDIDVFTIQGHVVDEDRVTHTLDEMRWLKNKVFYGSITPKALEAFL